MTRNEMNMHRDYAAARLEDAPHTVPMIDHPIKGAIVDPRYDPNSPSFDPRVAGAVYAYKVKAGTHTAPDGTLVEAGGVVHLTKAQARSFRDKLEIYTGESFDELADEPSGDPVNPGRLQNFGGNPSSALTEDEIQRREDRPNPFHRPKTNDPQDIASRAVAEQPLSSSQPSHTGPPKNPDGSVQLPPSANADSKAVGSSVKTGTSDPKLADPNAAPTDPKSASAPSQSAAPKITP